MILSQNCKDKFNQVKEKLFDTGFFHVFGSNIINQIIAFLSGIILVRILSKAEYGIYSYAYNIINFFLVFNGFGAASGLLQTCSEITDDSLRMKYYKLANRIAFLFDIFLIAGLVIVSWKVPFRITGTNEMLLSMIFLPVFMLTFNMKTTYFRATLRTKEFSYSNTANAAIVFVFSCVGAALFAEVGVSIGQTLAYLFSVIGITRIFGLPINLKNPGLSKNIVIDFFKIAAISAVSSGVSQIMNMLDVFVLGILIPNEEVIATYRVAATIPTALAFIPTVIIIYVYPYFAQHKDDGRWLKEQYRKLMIITGIINAVIATGLIVCAPLIIYIVFGTQYMDSMSIFRILALNYFFSGTFSVISGNLLVTQRKLAFNFWRVLIMGIMNCIGNVLFVTWWGPIGAAISTICVNILSGMAATLKMKSIIRYK